MAPNHGYVLTDVSGEPVSRTYQYRKVMKPMLERKRRARINRCLDELKDLMTGALQSEGENVAKLEKADILELTVRHLHKLRRQNQNGNGLLRPDHTYVDKFKAGFRHCAAEVTHFLGKVDQHTSVHVLKHLSGCIKQLEVLPASAAAPPPPPPPPPTSFTKPMVMANGMVPPHHRNYPQQYDHDNGVVATIERPVYQNFSHRPNFASSHQHRQHDDDDSDHDMYDYDDEDEDVDDVDRHNTPPMSPTIDVDDLPVWRPW